MGPSDAALLRSDAQVAGAAAARGCRAQRVELALLGLVLAVAAGLRGWRLGELSLWYDEVVTMRLVRTPSPAALLERLSEIDATRAPLHPLALQGWAAVFGLSDVSGRAFSVLCGVVTVGLAWWIGRMLFDAATGLLTAWLAAMSPLLVYYSREARMYAWLVMVTCACWGLLFALGRRFSWTLAGAYVLGLAALVYSHPLGLLMAAALAAGSVLSGRTMLGSWRRWLACHLAALGLVVPWLPRYFDHAPEFLSGRLPIRFLLGTPIGFVGGNSLLLLFLAALIAFGLSRRWAEARRWEFLAEPLCLALWLAVPPILLYAYSWLVTPIFGPPRYTLFVAPAYLILVAQGLARVPLRARTLLAAGLALVELQSLGPRVYARDLKADWRAFAAVVAHQAAVNPNERVTVLVKPPDLEHNVEVETARYYLPGSCRIAAWQDTGSDLDPEPRPGEHVFLVIGTRSGSPASPAAAPSARLEAFINGAGLSRYPGLLVYERRGRAEGRPHPAQPRGPEASGSSDPG